MTLPPPRPSYILRGHAAAIHAVSFSPANTRLVTADADGWLVVWTLLDLRPCVVWRAHTAAVLAVTWWGVDALISHGRDSKLVAWDLRSDTDTETCWSKTLPVDHHDENPIPPNASPKILGELTVNTLNYCAFTSCVLPKASPQDKAAEEQTTTNGNIHIDDSNGRDSLLLACPHTLSSEAIDLYLLPQWTRQTTIEPPDLKSPRTGLAMALALPRSDLLLVGYESGETLAFAPVGPVHPRSVTNVGQPPSNSRASPSAANGKGTVGNKWQCIYRARPHTQPILSLAPHPQHPEVWLTSGADAIIAEHSLSGLSGQNYDSSSIAKKDVSNPAASTSEAPADHDKADLELGPKSEKPIQSYAGPLNSDANSDIPPLSTARVIRTGHAGQQSIRYRSDGRVFATAGWDGRARVYSSRSLQEAAMLKFHKEGCYAVGFAPILAANQPESDSPDVSKPQDHTESRMSETVDHDIDSEQAAARQRVREIESSLDKNHQESLDSKNQAARPEQPLANSQALTRAQGGLSSPESAVPDPEQALVRQSPAPQPLSSISSLTSISSSLSRPSTSPLSRTLQRRDARMRRTHWLAVGSKDGKISLWDVF